MPYKRRGIFWTSVALQSGHCNRSCQTANRKIAVAIEAVLAECKAARRWDILDAVADGRLSVGAVYDARMDLDAVSAQLADIDLLPLVDTWQHELKSRGLKSAAKYAMQTKVVLGTNSFRSSFSRASISQRLSELRSTSSTRSRYRAAVSVFATWLVERGHLSSNPVRDVRGFGNAPPRDTWFTRADAQAFIAALPEPLRALEALMAGTGMEWQACARVRRSDIDFAQRTVYANGGKTPWRARTVRVTEDWCWPIIVSHARGYTPQARLFSQSDKWYHQRHWATLALPAFQGWPRHTLHDYRRTYSVNSLKDGMPPEILRKQLGHKDTTLIQKNYGKYVAGDDDYERWFAGRQVPEHKAQK